MKHYGHIDSIIYQMYPSGYLEDGSTYGAFLYYNVGKYFTYGTLIECELLLATEDDIMGIVFGLNNNTLKVIDFISVNSYYGSNVT